MKKRVKKKSVKMASSRKAKLRGIKKTLRRIGAKASRKLLKDNKIASVISSFGSREARPAPFDFPSSYDEDKLVLLVRDPWWIFAYWEVRPNREREILDELRRQRLQKDKTVLRIYDIAGTSVSRPNSFFDIELNFFANNWYVDVGKPDTDWVAELGVRATNGRFLAMVRSNTVKTPRFGISDTLDEEWMMPDDLYWKLFGRMAGLSDQKSSLDVREVLERYLKGIVSSESSPAPR